jgi:hypothetical protein
MIEAGVQIGLQNLAELLRDGRVCVRLIEPEDSLEADRFEIALGLRLLQRIGVDERFCRKLCLAVGLGMIAGNDSSGTAR